MVVGPKVKVSNTCTNTQLVAGENFFHTFSSAIAFFYTWLSAAYMILPIMWLVHLRVMVEKRPHQFLPSYMSSPVFCFYGT